MGEFVLGLCDLRPCKSGFSAPDPCLNVFLVEWWQLRFLLAHSWGAIGECLRKKLSCCSEGVGEGKGLLS